MTNCCLGTFLWLNDDTLFVLDQHAYLVFYSVNTPKLQCAGRHAAPFGHIIVISSQPAFVLTSYWCMLWEEAQTPILLSFGLIRPGLKLPINPTWGEHVNLYEYKQYNIIVSYTESQWMSVKYSECFLIALIFVYTTHYIWTYSNKTDATPRAGCHT